MSLHASTVDLNRTFRRGFTLTFTTDLLTKLLSAATVVVLIRGLTVSAYAYTTLFLTLAQFAGAAAGGGVRTRYLREEAENLSRGQMSERDGRFLASLLKGVLLVCAVGVCALPIAGVLHLGAKFGAGPGLIVNAVAFAAGYGTTELAIAHHQARCRFAMAGVLGVSRAGALLLAATLISFTHESVQLLSVSFVASMVLVGVATAAPIARHGLDRRRVPSRMLRFQREEGWLSLYYLAAAGFAYVDVFVASAILNQGQVATLGVALRYLTIVLAAVPSLGAVLRVRTAQLDMIDSPAAQRMMILRWMRSGLGPVGLILVLVAALAPWGLPILSGGRYPESVPVFQIFLIIAVSSYLSAPAVSVLMAQRSYATLAWIFLVGLMVNLIGDVLVAPSFGVIGIAVVSTATYLALDAVMSVVALGNAAGIAWSQLGSSLRGALASRRMAEIAIATVIALIVAIIIAGCEVPSGAAVQPTKSHTTAGLIRRTKRRSIVGPLSPRWYAETSPWNTPIGPDPALAPNDETLIAAMAGTPAIGVAYDYTPAIWYAHRDAPKVPVRIDVPRCGARTVWVPIPKGAIPDSSPEGHMIVAQDGTGTEYDFYKAQSPDRPPKSSVYYSRPCPRTGEWTAAKVVTTNWLTGSGSLLGSPRGSGTAEGSGVILPRDTEMPAGATWDHALAMAYRNTCSDKLSWCPIVRPATQEDGTCTDRDSCLPEGARIQLDPSIDCNTWPSIRYVWQRQICRTLQVYGGIIIDTNAGGPTMADQWHGSLIGYTWPWLRSDELNLPHDLLSHFRVLAWQ
jgi:O-antigen/teichoic acid export membrane protein